MSLVLRFLHIKLTRGSREDGLDIMSVELLSFALPTGRVDQNFDPLSPLSFTVGAIEQCGDPGGCTTLMQFVDCIADGSNAHDFFRGGMRVTNADLIILQFCPQDIEERNRPSRLPL